MNENEFERIFYYWRRRMYGHVNMLCQQLQKSGGLNPFYIIWDGLAYGYQGQTTKGLEQIQKVTNKVAMGLPLAVAQLAIHNMAKNVDYTSINQIESQIEGLKGTANAQTVVITGQILWLTGKDKEAETLVQPLTQQAPANKDAAALIGWIQLSNSDRNSGRWFDLAAAESTIDRGISSFTAYGKAMYFTSLNRWPDALKSFVQLSGLTNFPEASLERAHIYISVNNWDLALEAANEGAGHYISDIEMNFLNVINLLSHSGDLESARSQVKSLCQTISKIEGQNAQFIVPVVRVLTALSWADKDIVQACFSLLRGIAERNSDSSDVMTLYGQLHLQLGRGPEAESAFQAAIVLRDNNIEAMSGLIRAYILQNKVSDAKNQLDLLAVYSSPENQLLVELTKAIFERFCQIPPSNIDNLVYEMKKHADTFTQNHATEFYAFGKFVVDHWFDTLLAMKFHIVTESVNVVLNFCNTLEGSSADPKNAPVCDIIVRMLDYVPGSVPFSYYLAILAYGEGRYTQAMKAIEKVLRSKWGYNSSTCHLLLAQIRLQLKQFDEAENSLNRAVSNDFGIRSTLRYNLIVAELNEAKGNYDASIKMINDITKTVEFVQAQPADRVNVAIFLSKIYRKMGKSAESISTIDDAISKFEETEGSGRLRLYKASLLSKLGRTSEAVQMLEAILPDDQLYTPAKKKLAKIYITKMNDKLQYLKCFKELVESNPSKINKMLLGDAYIKVKRFDDAINYFNSALNEDPNDEELAIRYARSLMIVHQYDDAVQAYQQAAVTSNTPERASLELCKCLLKLRRYEDAMDIANEMLSKIDSDNGDWEVQYYNAQFNELLWSISCKTQDQNTFDYLHDALSQYDKLTSVNRVDIPADKLIQIKKDAALLYYKAGEIQNDASDIDAALESYQKSADLDETSTKSLLSVAYLYNERDEIDKCKDICTQILRMNPDCEDAALLLAEVSQSSSISDLENAFRNTPTFFRTLVRLIEVCAHCGELHRIPEYIKLADQDLPGCVFCKGLYLTYMGDPQSALKLLHRIHSDMEWGIRAQIMMFHIYVNPYRKYVWCEEKPLAAPKEIASARKLLQRMNIDNKEVLFATLLLSENTTETVKQALNIFESLDDRDLNVVIGKCKCYLRLDQQREATKNLNGIINGIPSHQDKSVFVEAFLMMTVISLKENSIDEALKFVERANELDQSCVKAWDLIAQINEKQKKYIDASVALEHAYELTSKNNFAIGYRLALCYMKASQPVRAIKVARQILAKHPNYPRIKEQVLIPCIDQLKCPID